MNVLLVFPGVIPVVKYGGTERVVWYLAEELTRQGHKVTLLVKEGSSCSFAKVVIIDFAKSWNRQIPAGIDIVHFHFEPDEEIDGPVVFTVHENHERSRVFNKNAIFVSKNHAERHNSNSYVHNGLDWGDYAKPDLKNTRNYFHFLGAARWRVKNLKGAIKVARKSKEELRVLGGTRLNFKMGFRLTLDPSIKFYGLVDNEVKSEILNESRGLIFPVRWNEPFGLAIIESLFFGCPIFGTPYGSLPELVTPEVGFLSSDSGELAIGIKNYSTYQRVHCHEYAQELFSVRVMAKKYIKKYEDVLNGQTLNTVEPQLIEQQEQRFLAWT